MRMAKMAPEKTGSAAGSGELREEYRRALERYLTQADEAALRSAYELGRKSLADGRSLMELATIHHELLAELMENGPDAESRRRVLAASAAFLAESVSPYEMAHRGFQEAVTALRQMNERLEEQIKGIAYAVHDDAGQLLVAVHLGLATLSTQLPGKHHEEIVQIEELLNDVEKQLRRYSHELRPTILDDLGWVAAIRFLADSVSKRSKLPIEVQARFAERLPEQVEIAIYRIVQEALNNAVKHAQARSILIETREEGGQLRCSVRDDGTGFDMKAIRAGQRGLGLTGMQERMNAVGGAAQIESTPGQGTQVLLSFPLERNHANSSRARG